MLMIYINKNQGFMYAGNPLKRGFIISDFIAGAAYSCSALAPKLIVG